MRYNYIKIFQMTHHNISCEFFNFGFLGTPLVRLDY
jgi:hypothetical protein